MSDIYDMKLHEYIYPDSNHAVMRVAGGWVYSTPTGAAFVPWHNEFMPKVPTLENQELPY